MRLSVVIPVFNEAEAVPHLLSALRPVLSPLDNEYELLFVDDGSRDHTLLVLAQAAQQDARIKIVSFTRNFGHQAAITAGLDFASGNAVIVMDADLQDPPELLPEMLRLFEEEGYEIVSPQRTARDETWFKRRSAALFYSLMRTLVDQRLAPEVGDFRLLSQRVVMALRQLREQHRFMRGLVAWLGIREAIVPFERRSRIAGATKYPLWKMARFSWTAISSFSAIPLRFSVLLGAVASIGAMIYLVYALFIAFIAQRAVHGWTSLVALQCLFCGTTLVCIGLIGDYVARIYDESKGRPLYIVNSAVNLADLPTPCRAIVFHPPSQC